MAPREDSASVLADRPGTKVSHEAAAQVCKAFAADLCPRCSEAALMNKAAAGCPWPGSSQLEAAGCLQPSCWTAGGNKQCCCSHAMCCLRGLRWPETMWLLQDVRQEWQHLLPKVLAPFKACPGETPRGVHIQRQVFCVCCSGCMHCMSSPGCYNPSAAHLIWSVLPHFASPQSTQPCVANLRDKSELRLPALAGRSGCLPLRA